jgi:hypothetical protein
VTPDTDMSLQHHVRAHQIELAKSLESRKALYLDIKFWIILRDVELGLQKDALEKELLAELREKVLHGAVFCPISDTTFGEMLKNADLSRRIAVAALMDELSLGVTIIPYNVRVGTELAHFLHSARTPEDVHPLKHLVWSKLSYVMGFVHPNGTPFKPADELVMQKMLFEHMWTLSMKEIIRLIGDEPLPGLDSFAQLATRLNDLNSQHAQELRSFEQTYKDEVHGVLDVFMDIAINIVSQMVRTEHGVGHELKSKQRAEEGRQLHNLLFAALGRAETKLALPTLHIIATIHAAIRWNRQQRLKANDFLDFQHATAALGYCDAFFTERSLASLVAAPHVGLDKTYGCAVVPSPERALDYLRTV